MLLSQPTAAYDDCEDALARMAPRARHRYAEIMHDVEVLINDHSIEAMSLIASIG